MSGTAKRLKVAHLAGAVFLITLSACSLIRLGKLSSQIDHLAAQGRYGEAIPMAQRMIAIYVEAFGPEYPKLPSR